MSNIFEALQRAEIERAGGNLPANVESVADLLEAVEKEIARKQAQAAAEESAHAPVSAVDGAAPQAEQARVLERAAEEVSAGSISAETKAEPLTAGAEDPAPWTADAGAEAKASPAGAVGETKIHETKIPETKISETKIAETKIAETTAGSRISAATIGEGKSAEVKSAETRVIGTAASASGTAGVKLSFSSAKVIQPAIASDSRLVCLTDQGGLAAEKFRLLGLKLRHMRERRKLKRIVITGTAPQEGKSLVALNLALNQARSKVLKTLVIDGDLRRPTVAARLGFDNSLPGLSECLRGERSLSEVIYKLHGTSLWLLPGGRAPENPLELMQGGRLPELLDRMGEFFDWIIIDTPPVVPVADTPFWMKLADGVLLVIREGVSEKTTVERALSSFDPTLLLGVVVNSCSRTEHDDYYSRYGQTGLGIREVAGGAEN